MSQRPVAHSRRFLGSASLLLPIIFFLCACPAKAHKIDNDKDVVSQLVERRKNMANLETDVKIRMMKNSIFGIGIEGHAAYRYVEGGSMLRLVAFGPFAIQVIDLLVKGNELAVKLPGATEYVGKKELEQIVADPAALSIINIMLQKPGLLFGGVPDDIESAQFVKRRFNSLIIGTGGDKSEYYVKRNREGAYYIWKAILKNEEGDGLIIVFSEFEKTETGVFPGEVKITLDSRVFMILELKGAVFNRPLPDSIFDLSMQADLGRGNPLICNGYLKINKKFQRVLTNGKSFVKINPNFGCRGA